MIEIAGYADLQEIGRGASATVYRATQVSFGRSVALKVLTGGGLDDDARRRFDRECLAVGNLGWHPRVVPVYDAGVSGSGHPYLAMELLPAGSLAARVRARRPVPGAEAASIGIQVADALEAAHRAGILHRDVKPGNILIGHFGDVKLGDFGIASIASAGTSVSDTFAGTLPYLAPELLDGQRASASSDVYSLGATLHCLLTARAPYATDDDDTPLAVLRRVSAGAAPDLRELGIDDGLAGVVERAMDRDLATRTATAIEVVEQLTAVAQERGWETPPTYLWRSPEPARDESDARDDTTQVRVRPAAPPTRSAPPADPPPAPPGVLPPPQSARSRYGHRRAAAAVVGIVLAAVVAAVALAAGHHPPVAATVDGTDIPLRRVFDLLDARQRDSALEQRQAKAQRQPVPTVPVLRGHGPGGWSQAELARTLQPLVELQVLQHELRRRGRAVSRADVEAARLDLANGMTPPRGGTAAASPSPVAVAAVLGKHDPMLVAFFVDLGAAQRALADALASGPAAAADRDRRLHAAYDAQKASLAQVCLNVIVARTRAAAAAARARVDAGQPFATVAKDVSTDSTAGAGGDAGCGKLAQISTSLGLAAGALPAPGTVLGPLALQGSFVVVRLRTVDVPSYAQARAGLESSVGGPGVAAAAAELPKLLAHAQVHVDPRYGTWDPRAGTVKPAPGH